MNRRQAILVAVALPQRPLAAEQNSRRGNTGDLALALPSIVILLDSPTEQARQRKIDPHYDEASGDFGIYTERMRVALKGHEQFVVRWSHAKRVTFPGTEFPPVFRRQVGGWGYVYFKPGTKPVVIQGVATDDELVCRAAALFKLQIDGYKCGA